jgi:hypothetical protein
MSPTAILFTVVAGIYLLDCFLLVPEDAIVLAEGYARRWAAAPFGIALGGVRKRAAIAGVLSPGATNVVLPPCSLAMSPQGIAWQDSEGGLQWLSYESLDSMRSDDATLHLTSDAAIPVHSRARARHLVAVLVQLRDAHPSVRAALLERELDRALDERAVRDAWTKHRAATTPLRAVSIILFLHLFVGWPLAVAWLGLNPLWPYLLVELVVLLAVTVWQFVRVHRRLFPEASLDVAELVSLALSPPAAVRAPTVLGRDLFGSFHPLAVVGALGSPEHFAQLASRLVRDLAYRAETGASNAHALAVASWFASRQVLAVNALASRVLAGEPLPDAPAQEHDGSTAYCPRCWTQFGSAEHACESCGGLALKSFS